jgi:hypothetical protein
MARATGVLAAPCEFVVTILMTGCVFIYVNTSAHNTVPYLGVVNIGFASIHCILPVHRMFPTNTINACICLENQFGFRCDKDDVHLQLQLADSREGSSAFNAGPSASCSAPSHGTRVGLRAYATRVVLARPRRRVAYKRHPPLGSAPATSLCTTPRTPRTIPPSPCSALTPLLTISLTPRLISLITLTLRLISRITLTPLISLITSTTVDLLCSAPAIMRIRALLTMMSTEGDTSRRSSLKSRRIIAVTFMYVDVSRSYKTTLMSFSPRIMRL